MRGAEEVALELDTIFAYHVLPSRVAASETEEKMKEVDAFL